MQEIHVSLIRDAIITMVQEINIEYPSDIYKRIKESYEIETSKIGKETLAFLMQNADVAKEKRIAICQDTGMVIVFLKIGQDVHFVGGGLQEAIQEGVRIGYEEGYLRKSVVNDPLFHRINTNDNIPAIIYSDIVDGSEVEIELGCKGFGSENMSQIVMLKPAQGVDGIKQAVLDTVKKAGPNACPPMVVGIGIGGTFDYAAVLAKKATLRPLDIRNQTKEYADLEVALLKEINALNIGPQGLKGDTTALGINIEYAPTHIAGLPVAINISCHVTRHAKKVIS